MAIERKVALGRLLKSQVLAQKHLQKIRDHPEHSSRNHWRHEVRLWLGVMESMVEHVGKKTSAQWRQVIENLRELLEAES
jgi:hypothetical protein